MVDETLEKIREKIIDRAIESDNLLSKYEVMLQETENQIMLIQENKKEHDQLKKLEKSKIKIDMI